MTLSRLLRIGGHRLQSLFRKEQLDHQLDQELLFHYDQLVQENIDAGMNPDDARAEAKRTLGNSAVFMDECRDERRVKWFHDFLQDLRYGLRMMRKHLGLTSIAAVSLAFGIGANTAILSVGSSLFLGTLPLPDADRLVVLRTNRGDSAQAGLLATAPDYLAWKERSSSFESIGANMANQQDMGVDETGKPPQRLFGQAATPSLFSTLRVPPMLGRIFTEEDVIPGQPADVIVLSYSLWQRNFGGDSRVIGRQIPLNGRSVKILGVMPEGFWYPNEGAEYWVPLRPNPSLAVGSPRFIVVTARLKSGVTIAQAQTDVAGIADQLAHEYPERHKGWSALVLPLRVFWFGWTGRPLMMLEGAVVLVLLIACANVSTLLLGRLPARREEVSMRVMLGAGRGRIVRQFLTESVLLSVIGGALGVAVAWW